MRLFMKCNACINIPVKDLVYLYIDTNCWALLAFSSEDRPDLVIYNIIFAMMGARRSVNRNKNSFSGAVHLSGKANDRTTRSNFEPCTSHVQTADRHQPNLFGLCTKGPNPVPTGERDSQGCV